MAQRIGVSAQMRSEITPLAAVGLGQWMAGALRAMRLEMATPKSTKSFVKALIASAKRGFLPDPAEREKRMLSFLKNDRF